VGFTAIALVASVLTGCSTGEPGEGPRTSPEPGMSTSPEPGMSTSAGPGLSTPPRAASATPSEPIAPIPGAESGIVTNVVDGDTIDVGGIGRIRVIGIDTPERGACGYDSATYAMSVLVLGKEVALVPGAFEDSDRYGRLLRYVDVGDVDAGLSLIEDGWAIARYDSRDGYGRHPREDAYVSADLAAADLGCYPDDEP
jgi:endonuclease YncB( thermonuclease family)